MKTYNNNTTVYFMDGINTILEKYKASNWSSFSTSAMYTLAPGVISHIISERKNNQDYYYHYDPIGNVQFITDSYGNVTVSYVQEGFGNILVSIGSLASNGYHLTTKELDPNTGLYYFFARWYDPVIGRWITQEPTGIDGPNLYHYVFNNPLIIVDVDGLVAYRVYDAGTGGGKGDMSWEFLDSYYQVFLKDKAYSWPGWLDNIRFSVTLGRKGKPCSVRASDLFDEFSVLLNRQKGWYVMFSYTPGHKWIEVHGPGGSKKV